MLKYTTLSVKINDCVPSHTMYYGHQQKVGGGSRASSKTKKVKAKNETE